MKNVQTKQLAFVKLSVCPERLPALPNEARQFLKQEKTWQKGHFETEQIPKQLTSVLGSSEISWHLSA